MPIGRKLWVGWRVVTRCSAAGHRLTLLYGPLRGQPHSYGSEPVLHGDPDVAVAEHEVTEGEVLVVGGSVMAAGGEDLGVYVDGFDVSGRLASVG